MVINKKKLLGLITGSLVLVMVFGCAVPPTCKVHPEFETRAKNIGTVGFVPPDIKIYELTAGGVHELMDDWSNEGKKNVIKSVTENFEGKHMEIKTLTADKDIEEEIADIRALYEAVSLSISLHTYGPFLFPEKQENFDYSIGPVEQILQRYKADALIFVYGYDEISTGGRQALIATGIVVGAITGVYAVPRGAITVLSVALVDKSGLILWYNYRGGTHMDLRKPESAARLVKSILSGFSGVAK